MTERTCDRLILLGPQSIPWASPMQLVGIAAQAGFDGVGLKLFGSAAAPAFDQVLEKSFVSRLRQVIEGSAVIPYVATIFYLTISMDWDGIEAALDVAGALNISTLQVIGDDPDWSRLRDSFARLCDLGAPRHLVCVLENAPYRQLATVAEIERLIADARRPNAGLCLNVVNHIATGYDAASLHQHTRHLNYVQLANAALTPQALAEPTVRIPRLPYGQGTIDLAQIVGALPCGVPVSPELAPLLPAGDLVAAETWALEVRIATEALLGHGVPEMNAATAARDLAR